MTDSGYQGIQKIYENSEIPQKQIKKNLLSKKIRGRIEDDLKTERQTKTSSASSNVLKSSRIHTEIDENFGLRFNLISGFYNWELAL
jgi:hypothetical protein